MVRGRETGRWLVIAGVRNGICRVHYRFGRFPVGQQVKLVSPLVGLCIVDCSQRGRGRRDPGDGGAYWSEVSR